jgi:MoxR-like ATPase
MNIEEFREHYERVVTAVSHVLVGQREVIDHALLAILARGHVLVEGVPGLGKTLLVRTLAHTLGASFKRIQFTPDLMPSDVTGGNVFNQQKSAFEFVAGPVFTQLLLADEINRAPAKTQSALLESMQELSVTVDGVTRSLPQPFFVMATQNPVESQGTYPLPEAQLDRFLMKVEVRHPSRKAEKRILKNHLRGFDPVHLQQCGVQPLLSIEQVVQLQEAVKQVQMESEVIDYITDITTRTRTHASVELGASPRASVGLLSASQARAASEGREFVIPDDVKLLAPAVLRHRLTLHPDAELQGVTPDDCIESVLREAPVPKTALA